MTNKIPIIKVKQEVKRINNSNPYLNDVVCLIGGFETEANYLEPKFYTTLSAAEAVLADGSETDTPAANLALKQVFDKDISGCLVVNVSVKTGSGSSVTWARSVTKKKLEDALAAVNQMTFGQLFVAEELTDELVTVIDTEAQARFKDKKPFGYIGVGTRNNATTYGTTAGKMGDWCYAFLTQALTVRGNELSLIESGAYLTSLISTLPIANSLTAKILDEVTDIGTTYTFADEDLGATLVGLGFFVVRLIDPLNNTYECVNSATNNGLDLYINRTRDYIVNDFALRQFLGEHNNPVTLDAIKMECNRILVKFRDNLGAVENINYAVEKVNSQTVNVILNSVEFADIITEIDVFVTIEVI
jgi:hypothetical protein